MFLKAHSAFGSDQQDQEQAAQADSNKKDYLQVAKACGEAIWKRGLIKQGYSLCHGISGNAYAFIRLYKATKERKYLWRARSFADFIFDYGKHGINDSKDRPMSLFEGLSGTVYFLDDILNYPKKAKFPCLDL